MTPDFSKRLVLLDRDGVLNEDLGDYVTSPDELVLLPQAIRACGMLTKAGFDIGICTNQAGISRGRYSVQTLAAIHEKLVQAVEAEGGRIARICYCPSYDNTDPNRKPNPGMLLDQAAFFGLDLAGVPFVGDSLSDVQAARAAGALPVLVQTGKGVKTLADYPDETAGTAVYQNLEQAVQQWLG